jgi:predicted nucleic acid-binding protein
MSADFLDSNVLLYLAWNEDRKASIIEDMLRGTPFVSAQVLNEIASVLRRKRKLDWGAINGFIDDLLPVVTVLPISEVTNRSARTIAERYHFAVYDAVIIASALEGDCVRLITEDMQHGQRIGDLTIVNPFR